MPEKSKSKYNSLKEWEKDFPVHYRDAKSQGYIEDLCRIFGWVLPKCLVPFATYDEASQWCIENGIETKTNYQKKYKGANIRLPSTPSATYKDKWLDWATFLGKNTPKGKATYDEASQWCIENNIGGKKDYLKKYKVADIILPSSPRNTYKKNWVNWYVFLGKQMPEYYVSYEQAQKWCIEKGINTQKDYLKKYKGADIILPSSPRNTYKNKWINWYVFLGKDNLRDFATYDEAQKWCVEKGITTMEGYIKKYKDGDIILPSNPNKVYKNKWINWYVFLGKKNARDFASYEQASQWCTENNLKGKIDYQKKYKDSNIKLPAQPNEVYKDKWVNWYTFLGKN